MNAASGIVRREIERVDLNTALETVHALKSDGLGEGDTGNLDTKSRDSEVVASDRPFEGLLS